MECAIGTIYTPSYANIFMANFEAKHIFPYVKKGSKFPSYKIELRGHDDVTFRVNNSGILIKIKLSS